MPNEEDPDLRQQMDEYLQRINKEESERAEQIAREIQQKLEERIPDPQQSEQVS